MKKTIEWHERCLENQKLNLKSKKIEIDRIVNDFKKLEEDTWIYERQIYTAKTRKMDDFDRERFLKPRKIEET